MLLRSARKALFVGGAVAALASLVLTLTIGAPFRSRPPGRAGSAMCTNRGDATRGDITSGGSSTREGKASRLAAPDLTLSFDAEPAYCEWDSIQPGFKCGDGSVDHSAPAQPPSAAFARDDSPGKVRHGRYSARVVLRPGDHASYSCQKEAVEAIKPLDEGEGTESWWGWSWKLPVGWRGTDSWGMLFEFTVNAFYWPERPASGRSRFRARSMRRTEGMSPFRALQRVLYRSAKQEPRRRFHRAL
jgi:hypothetical protein